MSDGWDRLETYASDTEEEEEVKGLAESGSPDYLKKRRVALKTVLEALIAEKENEEMQQRLRGKEYKSAREEERRERKGKEEYMTHSPQAHKQR